MQTTYPTFDDNATTLEQEMITVDPRRTMTEKQLESFAPGTGLDGVFLAGALSMMLTHERCGVMMWKSLAATTANPMLKTEYHRMEQETVTAVEAYETAITELGGDPMYISPAARATEAMDSKLIESLLLMGGADPMTTDAKTVNAAGLGAMACVMNVETLKAFIEESESGASKTSMERLYAAVGPLSHQHHEWAMTTQVKMATMAAKHQTMSKVMNKAESMVDKVQKKISQP